MDDLDELFNDFVMIEKEEINTKLNLEVSKEKLEKEERTKNSTKSEMLQGLK